MYGYYCLLNQAGIGVAAHHSRAVATSSVSLPVWALELPQIVVEDVVDSELRNHMRRNRLAWGDRWRVERLRYLHPTTERQDLGCDLGRTTIAKGRYSVLVLLRLSGISCVLSFEDIRPRSSSFGGISNVNTSEVL